VFRILIAIGQTPFDPTSGAAQATLHLAELLAGCACEVRCLATSGTEGVFQGTLPEGDFTENGVKHCIIPVDPGKKHSWHHLVGRQYDRHFDELLSGFRPDFVVTFGDEPPDRSRRARAVAAGSKVVFCLHNESYRKERPDNVTAFLSPSRYLADAYQQSWGDRVPIEILPTPMIFRRILADAWEPVFVTFVNPQPVKGLWFMIRFAEQLGLHHPDIPLRIIEGRATAADFLAAATSAGIDITPFENLFFSTSRADVREIWASTRILLAPAVWNEPAGRTPVEAMMNGAVPVVSNRGGLSEQLNSAGRVLPLPANLVTGSRYLPTAAEIRPWMDAVVSLCQDDKSFAYESGLAKREAQRFSQACLAPRYLQFLRELNPPR
jgi:glycosyltransferase involved in cell wall biosynthesis